VWKHSISQLPHSNGALSTDSQQQQQQQQSNQPPPVPAAGKQQSPTAAGPWTGRHSGLKAGKPALHSGHLADDELSIPTARDTNPGSSSSSSEDSSDGLVMINGLAVSITAAADGGPKGSPFPREGGLASSSSSTGSPGAQQNGCVKSALPATFGAEELLAYQTGAGGAEADTLRSTLAQHDLLREQPVAAAAQQHEQQDKGTTISEQPHLPPPPPQQQQQPQPQPPSIGSNPEQGNSYAARAAGLAGSSSQQRAMPSYSSAVGSGGSSSAAAAPGAAVTAPRAPAAATEHAASQQRRPQRPYSQAVASGAGAGSNANSASSSLPRPAPPRSSAQQQHQQQQPQHPQQQPTGRGPRADGHSSRGSGSPGSPSSGDPWAAAAPDAPASHHVPLASTDLERLLQQVTPMLHLEGSAQGLEDLRLADVWRFYQEPSLYGREVYTLGGTRGPSWSYFVPYLSAVQLFVPTGPKDPGTNRLYISDIEGWPKHMHLLFEYFERELPFNRMPLHDMIEALSGRAAGDGGAGAVLLEQQVSALHPASWFAVAWYPVYRIPDAPLTARFLTFHSFAQVVVNLRAQKDQALARPISLMPLQVIGLKWQNLQGERWLDNLPEAAAAAGGAQQPPHGSGSGGDEVAAGGRRGRMQHSNSVLDLAWQAHLSELQATAERLSRGTALRILGQMGAEPADLRHPDFEFFHTRG
jgi:hypothetical protein